MSEQGMRDAVQEGLAREGIDERVIAAGQFSPRGHSGAMFVGGVAGDAAGGVAGAAGEAAGAVAGITGGIEAAGAARGLGQPAAAHPQQGRDRRAGRVRACAGRAPEGVAPRGA